MCASVQEELLTAQGSQYIWVQVATMGRPGEACVEWWGRGFFLPGRRVGSDLTTPCRELPLLSLESSTSQV